MMLRSLRIGWLAALALLAVPAALPAQEAQDGAGDTRQRLQELERELATLRGRVMRLEDRLVALLGEPAEERAYDIPVGDSPVRGNPSAPLTLVMFGDYQSEYCTRARSAVNRLLEAYPNAVRLVYKHYPLRTRHPQAHDAALAAVAAQRQGKFWEMHEQLYRHSRNLEGPLYPVLAEQIGLDPIAFERDRTSLWALERLSADEELAVELELGGVPALFLNGHRLETWRYDYLERQVERMLEG